MRSRRAADSSPAGRRPIPKDQGRRHGIPRYELQLFEPDWGGWHTVVTAVSPEALETSMRLLAWQTGKSVRLVDPDGQMLKESTSGEPGQAPRSGSVQGRV